MRFDIETINVFSRDHWTEMCHESGIRCCRTVPQIVIEAIVCVDCVDGKLATAAFALMSVKQWLLRWINNSVTISDGGGNSLLKLQEMSTTSKTCLSCSTTTCMVRISGFINRIPHWHHSQFLFFYSFFGSFTVFWHLTASHRPSNTTNQIKFGHAID